MGCSSTAGKSVTTSEASCCGPSRAPAASTRAPPSTTSRRSSTRPSLAEAVPVTSAWGTGQQGAHLFCCARPCLLKYLIAAGQHH
jgi:hypothetical protein